MTMKEWFRHLQPVKLYVILTLTVLFFIAELVVSHVTHALTLLMDSYHVLCNIMALAGCIITIKYNKQEEEKCSEENSLSESKNSILKIEKQPTQCSDKSNTKTTKKMQQKENKLKNTFGWARIDVIIQLICCVFLASLCFSLVVEAMQTLVHIDHHDEMHYPIPVLCLGVMGLLLNGMCYLLIGGYTYHEGSFLHVTKSGDVVLDRVISSDPMKTDQNGLFRAFDIQKQNGKHRRRIWELVKDTVGCVLVIICATLCYVTEEETGKFIDPIFSIISAVTLLILSYPYIRESCLILLQTIPDTIDIYTLKMKLLQHFPGIVNVHDLHIWELTTNKVVSTAHIIFLNQKVYESITNKVTEFFLEHGITQVTIQPEFYSKSVSIESLISTNSCCLVRCQSEGCKTSHCCPNYEENIPLHGLYNRKKTSSKEIVQEDKSVSLKSVTIISEECIANSSNNDGNKHTESNSTDSASDEKLSHTSSVEINNETVKLNECTQTKSDSDDTDEKSTSNNSVENYKETTNIDN